ncbi:hypothetical protein D9M71_614660 [compost metagenome]
MAGLFLHAAFAFLGLAIIGRALPEAGRHHLRPGFQVAAMHRCLPVRVEGAAGDVGQFFRLERWPGGGHPGFADAAPGGVGHQAGGRQRRVAALGRAHADRGKALDQLHVAVAAAGGVDDVAHLQVLVEVDEILALRMGEDRPVEVDRRLSAEGRDCRHVQAEGSECLGCGAGAVGEDVFKCMAAIHRAGDIQSGG